MMIGKPEWFARRKYGGWGICPRTWQGWVYLAVLFIPFIIFQVIPFWDDSTRTVVTVGWILFVLIDTLRIMAGMKNDEREKKIEAIAERNAAWVMVAIIVAGLGYDVITSAMQETFTVNWFLVAALFGGVIAKAASNFYLERKGL
ncbi:MAG: hypothetical protein ABH828_03445 [archaeon]